MKGCVQWNPVYYWKDLHLRRGIHTPKIVSAQKLSSASFCQHQQFKKILRYDQFVTLERGFTDITGLRSTGVLELLFEVFTSCLSHNWAHEHITFRPG